MSNKDIPVQISGTFGIIATYANVAQSVEQTLRKRPVGGSIPFVGFFFNSLPSCPCCCNCHPNKAFGQRRQLQLEHQQRQHHGIDAVGERFQARLADRRRCGHGPCGESSTRNVNERDRRGYCPAPVDRLRYNRGPCLPPARLSRTAPPSWLAWPRAQSSPRRRPADPAWLVVRPSWPDEPVEQSGADISHGPEKG